MRRGFGVVVVIGALVGLGTGAAPPVVAPGKLTDQQTEFLARAASRIRSLTEAGRFAAAEKLQREVLQVRQFALGRNHWQARDAALDLERWARLAGLSEK